jgi:hypothetical protein
MHIARSQQTDTSGREKNNQENQQAFNNAHALYFSRKVMPRSEIVYSYMEYSTHKFGYSHEIGATCAHENSSG